MTVWNAARRGELLRELAPCGLLDEPRFVEAKELRQRWASDREIDAAIDGVREIGGRTVRLRIGLGTRFPYDLPSIYIAAPEELPFLPHVDRNGWICYVEREGVVIQASAPRHVIEDAFGRALQTVEDGLEGRNARHTLDELEAYWRQWSVGSRVPAYVDPYGPLRTIDVAFARRSKQRVSFPYVADSFDAVRAFDPTIQRCSTVKNGLFVPLALSVLDEQIDPRSFTDACWVREFVARHLAPRDAKHLSAMVSARRLWPFVVLSIPRPEAGRSLVALHYEQAHNGHPLVDGRVNGPVHHIALERRDQKALLERGGAATNLRKMRVAVVGCGAVGGHVALNLASAGVASLVLVDHDRLQSENTYRHVLGRSSIGQWKAVGLKQDIQRRYPGVAVTAVAKRIESVLSTPDFELQDFDVVVLTTGDVTLSRRLNAELVGARTASVFTWVEPLGIGGHALVAQSGDTRGCYDCLFWDVDGRESLANRADFAAPGQRFTRDVTGCASVFTPYGNLDAIRTAELAARQTLSVLSGTTSEPRLVSWRGDSSAFLAVGYRLSARWDAPDSQRFPLAHAACPVCRSNGV